VGQDAILRGGFEAPLSLFRRGSIAREEVLQGMYRTVKGVKPTAQVGWHVDHEGSPG
jgi:hypothetical protein